MKTIVRVIPGVFLLALAVSVTSLTPAYAQTDTTRATVTAAALTVRAGPGTEYDPLGYVLRGETLPVSGRQAGWVQVTWQGTEAWVSAPYVDLGKATPVTGAEAAMQPAEPVAGTVSAIAPASESVSGVVNYPVTVHLGETLQGKVRPGMTAVATLLAEDVADGWLVPTSSIRERDGDMVVMVMRNGQPAPITVTIGQVQGEWTVVYSPDLAAGDTVIGSTASFVDEENQFQFGPPNGDGPSPGAGFRGADD